MLEGTSHLTSGHILVRQSRNFSHRLVLSAVGEERRSLSSHWCDACPVGRTQQESMCVFTWERLMSRWYWFTCHGFQLFLCWAACSGKILQVQGSLWTFTDTTLLTHSLLQSPSPRTLILLFYRWCKVSLSQSSALHSPCRSQRYSPRTVLIVNITLYCDWYWTVHRITYREYGNCGCQEEAGCRGDAETTRGYSVCKRGLWGKAEFSCEEEKSREEEI